MLDRSPLRCSNKNFQNDSYLIIADFIKKIAFIQVVKIFGFFQNSIAIITELDEINVRKKQNLFLVLTLAPKYSTIPRKNIMKVLSELIILIFKLKVGKCIVFSKTPIFWTCKGPGRKQTNSHQYIIFSNISLYLYL